MAMGAAGRESYAAAADALDAGARKATPAALAKRAEELLGVAGLLAREPRLRRALSDPARTPEDRVGLMTGLLTGKVSAGTIGLLSVLVRGRWSTPSELLDGVERLGVEALLASADRAGDLSEVEDELFRFGQVVSGTPALAVALGDSTTEPARRAELVKALLSGKAKPITIRLAELALEGFGGRSFEGALIRLVELAAERRDRQVAYVTVAGPLNEEEERRLGAKLSELYGREVALKITVDPEILGGISLRVGNDLYDGTILRRLTETRIALTGRK
jgi:F-type H+-transporting ATPase subunit delta